MNENWPLLHPVPIVLIGVRSPIDSETANFTTIGDIAIAGLNSPLVMLSLHERHLSREGLDTFHRFSIHVPDPSMVDLIRKCGTVSGREVDKSSWFDFEWKDNIPVIFAMPIILLCETAERLQIGQRIIYIAKVIGRTLRNDVKPDDLRNLKTLQYGLDDRFYSSGQVIPERD